MPLSEMLRLNNEIVEIVTPQDRRRQDHGQGRSRSNRRRFGEERAAPAQEVPLNTSVDQTGVDTVTDSPLPIPCRADRSGTKRAGAGDVFVQNAMITVPLRGRPAYTALARGNMLKLKNNLPGAECFWWEIDSVATHQGLFPGDSAGTLELVCRERQANYEGTK